jgi:hypothetical protein
MLELIGLAATVVAGGFGYIGSRDFVTRRLRYVDHVQRPSAPLVAGTVAALAAAPLTWVLPLVGAGTAIIFGAAVGAGTRAGARRIRALPGA